MDTNKSRDNGIQRKAEYDAAKAEYGDCTFGKFITKKREAKQLSIRGAAAIIPCDASYLSAIEKGKLKAPSRMRLEDIARAYSMNTGEAEFMKEIADAEHIGLSRETQAFIREHDYLYTFVDMLMLFRTHMKKAGKEDELTEQNIIKACVAGINKLTTEIYPDVCKKYSYADDMAISYQNLIGDDLTAEQEFWLNKEYDDVE
jgi:transcriptional regulator with XRE-family HTH domain